MAIYIVSILLISISGCVIFYNGEKSAIQKKIFLFFSFIILSTISGLRASNIGTDTNSYINIFEKVIAGESNFKQEIGYIEFNKFVSFFSKEPNAIIIATSIFITLGVMIFIYYNSSNVVLSVYLYITLYYYFFSFNAVRQFMAIVLVINSFYFAKKQKIVPFSILIIIASLFHSTALLGSVLYVVCFKNITMKRIISVIFISTAFTLLYEPILNIVVSYFPKYDVYIGSYTSDTGGIMTGIVYTTIFIITLICKPKQMNDEYGTLLMIAAIAACLGIMGYISKPINRTAWQFDIFSIIIIPYIARSDFWNKGKALIHWMIIITGIIYLMYYFGVNWHHVLPYRIYYSQVF